MTAICPVCQYPAKSESVLTAHRKFQHEGGDPVNPDQPTLKAPRVRIVKGGDTSPATPEAVVFKDEPVSIKVARVLRKPKTKRVYTGKITADGEAELVTVPVEPVTLHTSREAWMIAAVEALTPWYVEVGHEVPPVRVSIGWPGGRSDATVLGSCWAKESVKDGKAMIFVSPVQDDPVEVLETIAHELIHAINHAWGHGAEFKKVAKAIGIENGGVCKTNRAESPALYAKLDTIAAALGTFPHSAIGTRTSAGTITGTFVDPKTGKRINPRNGKPVQGTRMLKVVCPEDGYTVRTTSRWLAVGNPSCPEGHEMVAVQNER